VRIFRHYLPRPIVLLALIETAVFLLIPFIAARIRLGIDLPMVGPLWPRAVLVAAVLMLCMVAMGLYSVRLRTTYAGVLMRVAASVAIAMGVIALIFYAFPQVHLGRGIFGYTALLAFFASALIRLVFLRLVDEAIFKRRVLVFGCGRQALSISRLRRRSDQRGFAIIGYLPPNGDALLVPPEKVLTPGDSLLAFAREMQIDELVIAMDDRRRSFPVEQLLECRLAGIEVVDIVSFLERETGKVRLDVLNPSWMIFGEGFRRDSLRLFSERAFDVVVSLALLALTWPVMLLTALAIKLEDGFSAPALYKQKRVGLEGKVFEVLKFRSMRVDAEEDGRARWAESGDRRVTRVGAVIRKVRIDELPQIINVLKDDMSFVGPRPERPEFVAELNERIPYYRERHCVKPGITGWAQLCYPYGSSEQDAAEKLQYDLYYVKNHSLMFDLIILLQTAEVVLWGKGGR
jgi:sugar transferase (PEP-CTERM system associated)